LLLLLLLPFLLLLLLHFLIGMAGFVDVSREEEREGRSEGARA